MIPVKGSDEVKVKVDREDRLFSCNNMTVIERCEDFTVYRIKDVTGEGIMTCHKVFQGIDLIYNDFHMLNCFSEFVPKVEMIGIDHCREGRIEWEFEDNSYMYLGEGDLQINSKDNHAMGFGFPLSHYHGITVAVYVEEAVKTLCNVLDGFSVDLYKLREKFCIRKRPFIMRAEDSIEHIFSELYTIPDKVRKNYFKIKVLELLLFLSILDVPLNGEERPYFPRKQVEKVKSVMKYITKNVDKHITLKELSLKFNMPITSLKLCFKGVYGTSPYSYMRYYRMHVAASMLRGSDESIADIAGKVGYDNSSKFSAAFKSVKGMCPYKYRKSFV